MFFPLMIAASRGSMLEFAGTIGDNLNFYLEIVSLQQKHYQNAAWL